MKTALRRESIISSNKFDKGAHIYGNEIANDIESLPTESQR